MKIEYEIIRSNRKSLALQIRQDGAVVVRAPYGVPQEEIDRLVSGRAEWIQKNVERVRANAATADTGEHLSYEDIQALADKAMEAIPERVRHFAQVMGVTYGRITIRNQKTRWGSCSARGNLNFNCLLMLMPPEILDYVVVHELAHRKEMNHSDAFWSLVGSVLPDYRQREKWLRENGVKYMRMQGMQ